MGTTLKIGQLARAAGVNVETIRYYERRGLLPEPPRTRSGYREYPESDVARLGFIRRAQELGFTLKEVKELIREGNVRRVIIRNAQGRVLLDMPLNAGVVGAALLPFWVAVGGIVALAKDFTIHVERDPGTGVVKRSEP